MTQVVQQQYYKWLGGSQGLTPIHGGTGDYVPGEWRRHEGPVKACSTGLHACREIDLPLWLSEALWEAEVEGAIENEDKVLCTGIKITKRLEGWNAQAAVCFATACAARAERWASGDIAPPKTVNEAEAMERAWQARAILALANGQEVLRD